MNIVFVTTSIGFGGAAKNLILVAEDLVRRGHNVGIFNLQDYTLYERNLSEQIELFSFKKSWISSFSPRLDQLLQLRSCTNRYRANVVVAFKSLPNFLVGMLRFVTNISTVMSERADPFRHNNVSIQARIRKFFIDRCDGGVFQLEAAKFGYGRKLQKKGVVIPNIVPLPKDMSEVVKPSKVVVSIGRFENLQKRYDVMLDAFSLFSKKHPDYVLKLYGEGGDEELIRKWIKEKNLETRAFVMGYTSTPLQEMLKAEIFLITSDFEGISNSLLEAMSVGKPTVSTDSSPGGARSIIKNRENGILVPCGAPEKISEALCEYAEDEEMRKTCGANARKITSLFSKELVGDMWEDYLIRITCRKRRENVV